MRGALSPVALPYLPAVRSGDIAKLVDAAAIFISAIPETSAAKLMGVIRLFTGAMAFWGVEPQTANVSAVLAFVMARVCPPVGMPLPPGFDRPVLPTTVAGDIDALRRGLRLRLPELRAWAGPIQDELVSTLIKNLGGRIRRLKSAKRPIMWTDVQAFCDGASSSYGRASALAAFALAFAFIFATRISELVSLLWTDTREITLISQRRALAVTFRRCKNRQSLLMTHEPFTVTSSHPTLMATFARYAAHVPVRVGPLLQDERARPVTRAWFAAVLAAAVPEGGVSPHSVRVGMATELWAAGASLSDIMAAGRWTSPAAVLYIISSLDATASVLDRVGGGGLIYTRSGLQQSLRTQVHPIQSPEYDAAKWARIAAPIDADERAPPSGPPPPAASLPAGTPPPRRPVKRRRLTSLPAS